MQYIKTARSFVAGYDVAHGVVAHMAHMDLARGIREHFEDIIFRFGGSNLSAVGALSVPGSLPLRFDFLGVVSLAHDVRYGVFGLLAREQEEVTVCRHRAGGLGLISNSARAQLTRPLQNFVFKASYSGGIDHAIDPNTRFALLLAENSNSQTVGTQAAS